MNTGYITDKNGNELLPISHANAIITKKGKLSTQLDDIENRLNNSSGGGSSTLISPSGKKFKLIVSDSGVLSTEEIVDIIPPPQEGLIHSFIGSNATNSEWVDEIDSSYKFTFTGMNGTSTGAIDGKVKFNKTAYGVLNKALNGITGDFSIEIRTKLSLDSPNVESFVFGIPSWELGFALGLKENKIIEDSKLAKPLVTTNANISTFNNYRFIYKSNETKLYVYTNGTLNGFGTGSLNINQIINLNNEGNSFRGNNEIEYIKIYNRDIR